MTAAKTKTPAKKTATNPTTSTKKEPTYQIGEIRPIPLNKIIETENILRHKEAGMPFIARLALSMLNQGYQPVDVYIKDGKIYLSDGFTRFQAARSMKWSSIKCTIIAEEKALSNAVHKAMMRKDLSPLERAEAFKKYQEQYGVDDEGLSKEFNRSLGNIRQTMSYLQLPEEIKNLARGKDFTFRELDALLALKDKPEEQKARCEKIITQKAKKSEQNDKTIDAADLNEGEGIAAVSDSKAEKKLPDGSKKPSERNDPFETLTDRIEDFKTRLDKMLKPAEPSEIKKRGPKTFKLEPEHKKQLQDKFCEEEFKQIFKDLGLEIIKVTEFVIPAKSEENKEPTQAPQVAEPDSEPETATEVSDVTPETPESPKEEA